MNLYTLQSLSKDYGRGILVRALRNVNLGILRVNLL